MRGNGEFIAVQQLLDIKKIMGSELYLAFDIMATKLGFTHGFAIEGKNARQSAELREARKILLHLKNPDSDMTVSREEMSWALCRVLGECEAGGLQSVALTMRNVALMLGIDVSAQHEMPRDLDNKICNAVKVLAHGGVPVELLAAVG